MQGYPELGNVLLASLERLDDSADDVEAFFGVALGDFSADDGFGAYEEAFVRLVEVLYRVVCVDEGEVTGSVFSKASSCSLVRFPVSKFRTPADTGA